MSKICLHACMFTYNLRDCYEGQMSTKECGGGCFPKADFCTSLDY